MRSVPHCTRPQTCVSHKDCRSNLPPEGYRPACRNLNELKVGTQKRSATTQASGRNSALLLELRSQNPPEATTKYSGTLISLLSAALASEQTPRKYSRVNRYILPKLSMSNVHMPTAAFNQLSPNWPSLIKFTNLKRQLLKVCSGIYVSEKLE